MLTLKSSGKKTGDGVIAGQAAIFGGCEIITDGVNDAKVILYNNASAASGQIVFEGTVPGGNNFGGATFETTVRADLGLYLDITGTGAAAIIYFDLA